MHRSLLLLSAMAALTTSPQVKAEVAPAACERAAATPHAPPPRLAALVGQYGAADAPLDVYEVCGRLFAKAKGRDTIELTPRGPAAFDGRRADGTRVRVRFETGGAAVTIDKELFARHDFGAETEAKIRVNVHADPQRLRDQALAAHPPAEPAPKRASDLVSIPSLDPTIHIHTLYAGTDNFLALPIYERPGAFAQRPVAEALVRVQKSLRKQGYGLLITDGYRPWFATKMFWDATPPEDHIFVADPSEGSRHNRGCAVDLTLYVLKTGKPVTMTAGVDEMSSRSFADYVGGTSRQRWYRALLRREMEAQGFAVYPYEWWHFDYKDWRDYPIGTATYTELFAGKAH